MGYGARVPTSSLVASKSMSQIVHGFSVLDRLIGTPQIVHYAYIEYPRR